MKRRIIKSLWVALATLSALLAVVSCVKDLAVKEQEVNFDLSLTTEQSQIVKGDSTVTTQLLINEDKADCPRPTKYSVSFTYDEEAGTLFFLGNPIQSGKPISLSSLSDLALTYQAKKLVGNKVDVTVTNDAPKELRKELVWNILAEEAYWVKSEQEGDGEITITGCDDLDAVKPDTKLAVTAKPADGWELVALTANDVDILEDKSFVVTENTTVCAVFTTEDPETYAVTLTKEGEGKVAISGSDNLDAVVAGTKLTITATPADGWEIASMTANGIDILLSKSFVVKSNTTVKVVFKRLPPKTYAVTLTKEGDGKVGISGSDNLDAVVTGAKLTVSAEPADGWEVKSITANGKDITTDKSFVVTSNTLVKVVFKRLPPKTYKVTLTKEGDGTVAISGADNLGAVVAGSKLTVSAEPADGWEVKSITANGKDIMTEKSFVVTSNTVVKVVFKRLPPKTYKVTLSKEGDGTVAISGSDNLDAVVTGSKLTVSATPSDGWEIGSITVNGKDITTDKSFVVTSNTVVKVVFKRLPPKTYTVTLAVEGGDAIVFIVLPSGYRKKLEVGKAISVPADTKLAVDAKPATPGFSWAIEKITANGKDITTDKSFVVTQDTTLKVVVARTLSTEVFMNGRGKVSVTVHDGRKKVYTLQDKPNKPDDTQYILSSISALLPGTKLTVTAEPADGWELEGITANRKDITASKTFNVMKNSELRVFFRKKTTKTYKVTVVCSEGGSIELKRHNRVFDSYESVDLDRVPEGTYLTAFSNPNEGYVLSECLFNGILQGGGVINKDTEVRAVFQPKYSTNKNKSNF